MSDNATPTPTAGPGEAVVEVIDLHKSFGSIEVLKGISTVIHRGEVVCVIGPSGSGKSTLLRCVNLLEQPTSGRVVVMGEEVTDPDCDIDRVRSNVGMVFQQFNLFPHINALQNCTIGQISVLKRPKEEAATKAQENLAKVGLAGRESAFPAQLSGGQQQRVAIARALSMDPGLMLFDEPTSALDPEMINEVLDVMVELAKEGMTMIVVTHEMGFARKVAHRVIFMDAGRIVEDAKKDDFFGTPRSERAQLFLSKILHH